MPNPKNENKTKTETLSSSFMKSIDVETVEVISVISHSIVFFFISIHIEWDAVSIEFAVAATVLSRVSFSPSPSTYIFSTSDTHNELNRMRPNRFRKV